MTIAELLSRDEPLRWLFTGDSITHGAGHTYGERDFVQLIEERVRWELGRRRDHIIRTAISGRTVADLEADLDWSVRDYRPDIVSLMFGLNDCVATADTTDFSRRYRAVIDTLRSDGAAIILHTPNRFVNETVERQRNLPGYVDAIRELASKTDVVLVDHYADWKECDDADQLEHWLEQGCHPGGPGHRVLARSTLTALGLWDPTSPTGRFFIPAAEYLPEHTP